MISEAFVVSGNCLDKAWKGALATERAGRHEESVEQADDESSEHVQADDESQFILSQLSQS